MFNISIFFVQRWDPYIRRRWAQFEAFRAQRNSSKKGEALNRLFKLYLVLQGQWRAGWVQTGEDQTFCETALRNGTSPSFPPLATNIICLQLPVQPVGTFPPLVKHTSATPSWISTRVFKHCFTSSQSPCSSLPLHFYLLSPQLFQRKHQKIVATALNSLRKVAQLKHERGRSFSSTSSHRNSKK